MVLEGPGEAVVGEALAQLDDGGEKGTLGQFVGCVAQGVLFLVGGLVAGESGRALGAAHRVLWACGDDGPGLLLDLHVRRIALFWFDVGRVRPASSSSSSSSSPSANFLFVEHDIFMQDTFRFYRAAESSPRDINAEFFLDAFIGQSEYDDAHLEPIEISAGRIEVSIARLVEILQAGRYPKL
ncbi:hypothetical protein LTR28_004834 [Elasticomyces elasticus]|nr:hypothetical protein LTR28_004834 [Elasticomyces elasticus]